MANIDYILLAAKTMADKGEKESMHGLANAANSFRLAAKKYREAAGLDPARSAEFTAKAEEYENRANSPTSNSVNRSSTQNGGGNVGGGNGGQSNTGKQTEANTQVTAAVKKADADMTVEEALEKLNSLVGLAGVKEKVQSWVSQIRIFKRREELGLKAPDGFSYHLVFSGNPGTGKTTVARLMAQIYKSLGILKEGQLIEASSSDLVAGYVGQTATKTREVVNTALGGVLFIDEAYTLNGNEKGNEFGQQAIDELLKCMEDHRNELVVIVAGYTDLMAEFIDTNPGLQSRFCNMIEFDDYTGDELLKIFDGLCSKNDYVPTPTAKAMLKKHFDTLYANRDRNFGNGRTVRNTFQQIVLDQSQRLDKLCMTMDPSYITREMMTTINEQDLATVLGGGAVDLSPEYERTKLETNDVIIYGYLAQNNIGSATVALCSRLESLLKHIYRFEGDLSDMVNKLRDCGKEQAKRLTRDDYDCIYRIRKYRNAHIHSAMPDVEVSHEDIVRCMKLLSILE